MVKTRHALLIFMYTVPQNAGTYLHIAAMLDILHKLPTVRLFLLFCFTVSNTEGLTATCATAFVTYQTGTEVIRTVLDLAYNKV